MKLVFSRFGLSLTFNAVGLLVVNASRHIVTDELSYIKRSYTQI
jgi:hypothetical protein